MRTRRAALLLTAGACLVAGTVLAQDTANPAARKPAEVRTGAVRQPQPALQTTAELPAGVTIKHFGVAGPVTGGQNSFGLLQLSGPAPAGGVTVQLSSNNPAISVPATITVAPGTADQSFQVTTAPVAAPTTVTISAKLGAAAATQTAAVTVVPPSLAFVTCTPQTVPAGTPATCKVQLDGPAASPSLGAKRDERVSYLGGLSIALATSNPVVATVPATVIIVPGQKAATFQVVTKPLAQSSSALISAAYGGLTKGKTLYVQPVSLQYVACGESPTSTATACEILLNVYTSGVMGNVRLTAPAPAGGLVVKLSGSPNLVRFWNRGRSWDGPQPAQEEVGSIRVPEGKSGTLFDIRPVPVAVDTRVTVSASAPLTGDTRTLVITVKAPGVTLVQFKVNTTTGNPKTISGVPIGGRKVGMRVRLNGWAPSGGWPLELKYSGTTDITGPAQVTIPALSYDGDFEVTVGPCSLYPVCEVVASTGSIKDTLFVKP